MLIIGLQIERPETLWEAVVRDDTFSHLRRKAKRKWNNSVWTAQNFLAEKLFGQKTETTETIESSGSERQE